MRTDLTLRTLILATWLMALLYAGTGPQIAPLATTIGLLWAAPMVRDRRRRGHRRPMPSETD